MLNLTQERIDDIGGMPVYVVTLSSDDISVSVTNLGCSITSICTPDRSGRRSNIVAGFDDIMLYAENRHYLGCVIGRYANRIARGRFNLDGRTVQLTLNDGANHLHGGFEGFNKKIWTVSRTWKGPGEAGVTLEYSSQDGEEGYPGNLSVKVSYWLDGQGALRIEYQAVTDHRTPVSLSNHSYFNLSAFEQPLISDHVLVVHAAGYTEKSETNLPTGHIGLLDGSPLDLTRPVRLGDRIDQLIIDRGFDHNYVLKKGEPDALTTAAELYDPYSGRQLRVITDQPGLQVYTANWWDGSQLGTHGIGYSRHAAIALETQSFPDSPNHRIFPNVILDPGDVYRSTTIFAFSIRP
jgi:aldose 1-epimerase